MEIIPDKRKVVLLVEQAYEGKLCLPNFQRDFVWRREEVADLIRSIVRRYFIGSFLLLRSDPQQPPFAPVPLRGAKPLLATLRPELLILDGQQRLTSLIYALTAPDLKLKDSSQRRWFFLDLNLLLEDLDSDAIVFDRAKRELDGLDSQEVQFQRRILPCTALLKGKDFLKWRDGLDDWLRSSSEADHRQFREEWRDSWTNVVTDFQTFEVPIVELPQVADSDSESIGKICAIFEKLNSTGVVLSVYDLLTARLYRSGIKIHDLWDASCREHKRLREWSKSKADTNKFGVLVLRTLALLRGLDPKPKALINLEPKGFEEDWRRATAAIERSIEVVTHVSDDGFGVFDLKWLPGYGLLPVLAALRAEIDSRKLGETPRRDLRRWYWCNVFLERYSSAVESKSRKDYVEMLARWIDGGPEPSVFAEAQHYIGAPGYTIQDSASFASSVYSGVFCRLAIQGARDWHRAENIQLQDLQDHHIFPRDYLKRHGITKQVEVNTILNRTLISDQTNGRIRAQAPSSYLTDSTIFPGGASAELLEPHFLSDAAVAAMHDATDAASAQDVGAIYERFLRAREAEIVSDVRSACGVV